MVADPFRSSNSTQGKDQPMDNFWAHLATADHRVLIGMIAVVLGFILLFTFILAIYRYNVRALADQTTLQRERQQAEMNLKRELIQRGLPAQELERYVDLLRLADQPPPAPSAPQGSTNLSDEGLRVRLAQDIASLEDIEGEDIEKTLALLTDASRERQTAVLKLIEDLTASGAETGVILAAIRSLGRMSDSSPKLASASATTSNLTPTA
jgi:hypothetical protein